MTMNIGCSIGREYSFRAVRGDKRFSKRAISRVAYESGKLSISTKARRSFFPAAPFDAQSLAGTGALVFEGEMVSRDN